MRSLVIAKYPYIAGFLFITASGSALALESKPADDKEIPVVSVKSVKTEELFDMFTYPARGVPKVSAAVLSDSEGVVTKIFAPLGTKVKRGERLMQVKHTDPIYQYAAATVRAPVNGIVSSLEVREGTQVTKNQALLTVTDPGQVNIQVEIAAIDLASFRAGVEGELKVAGREDALKVKVMGGSPFVSAATGTASCELSLADAKATLSPGLVGQVSFRANVRKGIMVPDHALYYKDGSTYLRIVDGEQVSKKVLVTLGRKQRGMVEILKGVSDGQVVIERASRFVGEGQKVQVQEEKKKEG